MVAIWTHDDFQRFRVEGLDVLEGIAGKHGALGEPDLDGRVNVTTGAVSILLVVAWAGALAVWAACVLRGRADSVN